MADFEQTSSRIDNVKDAILGANEAFKKYEKTLGSVKKITESQFQSMRKYNAEVRNTKRGLEQLIDTLEEQNDLGAEGVKIYKMAQMDLTKLNGQARAHKAAMEAMNKEYLKSSIGTKALKAAEADLRKELEKSTGSTKIAKQAAKEYFDEVRKGAGIKTQGFFGGVAEGAKSSIADLGKMFTFGAIIERVMKAGDQMAEFRNTASSALDRTATSVKGLGDSWSYYMGATGGAVNNLVAKFDDLSLSGAAMSGDLKNYWGASMEDINKFINQVSDSTLKLTDVMSNNMRGMKTSITAAHFMHTSVEAATGVMADLANTMGYTVNTIDSGLVTMISNAQRANVSSSLYIGTVIELTKNFSKYNRSLGETSRYLTAMSKVPTISFKQAADFLTEASNAMQGLDYAKTAEIKGKLGNVFKESVNAEIMRIKGISEEKRTLEDKRRLMLLEESKGKNTLTSINMAFKNLPLFDQLGMVEKFIGGDKGIDITNDRQVMMAEQIFGLSRSVLETMYFHKKEIEKKEIKIKENTEKLKLLEKTNKGQSKDAIDLRESNKKLKDSIDELKGVTQADIPTEPIDTSAQQSNIVRTGVAAALNQTLDKFFLLIYEGLNNILTWMINNLGDPNKKYQATIAQDLRTKVAREVPAEYRDYIMQEIDKFSKEDLGGDLSTLDKIASGKFNLVNFLPKDWRKSNPKEAVAEAFQKYATNLIEIAKKSKDNKDEKIEQISNHAGGGYFSQPTRALIGEAGGETLVPDKYLGSLANKLNAAGAGANYNITIALTPNSVSDPIAMSKLTDHIKKTIFEINETNRNRGGVN